MTLLEHLLNLCLCILGVSGGGQCAWGFLSGLVDTSPDSRSKPSSDVMVTMDHPVFPIVSSFSKGTSFNSREDHVTAMAKALQTVTTANQAPVMAALQMLNVQAEPYWLTNQIYIKGASPLVIQTLKTFGVVKAIVEEKKIPILPLYNQTIGQAPIGPSWNIKKISAHKLWKKGIKGRGIVVAGIDTGVKGTHSSLRENYVGNENHGWFDPVFYSDDPYDVHGHGTHTTATMVGNNGIGAAPSAKWMACKGCTISSCLQHALLACGQYVLCPSQSRSKNLNCTNVPHVVNNSWGGPGGQSWYEDVIHAWRVAGIIPFFAIGNNGPGCATSGHPGDAEEVIAVGATDYEDRLAKFSSRGPKITFVPQNRSGFLAQLSSMFKKRQLTDIIKPEISAPGHQINSAGVMTDNAYKVQSGTSMASPLAAGAAALLLSENPDLTFDEIKHLMLSTASHRVLPVGNTQCGDIQETEFPNHLYGHGRLNIYKAYKKMLELEKLKDENKADKESKKNKSNEQTKPNEDTNEEAAAPAKKRTPGEDKGGDDESAESDSSE